jgi:DNA polymerase III delta subunit
MVTLLYGDDQVSLGGYLDRLKEEHKDWEICRLDLTSAKEEELNLALNSRPLLACGRLVILENWFSQKKRKPNLSEIEENVSVILLERSRIAQNQIKNLPPGTKVFKFYEDPVVFRFLDSLFAGNKKRAFFLYCRILDKRIEPEMLYYLLVSHLRRILIAKESQSLSLAQLENLAPWQVAKYENLATRFDRKRLIFLYQKLLDIDQALKTGSDLSWLLPFLILELTKKENPV